MTRPTKTRHEALSLRNENGKHLYSTQGSFGRRDDVIKAHRIYVRGVDDDAVQVTGLWIGGDNHLLMPTTLLYLNRLLQWFDWATLWGIGIELPQERLLIIEITTKVDRPYLEYQVDQAYIAWLKRNPGGSVESWTEYATSHVKEGRVECEIGSCEERALAGSTCCMAHQEFARR